MTRLFWGGGSDDILVPPPKPGLGGGAWPSPPTTLHHCDYTSHDSYNITGRPNAFKLFSFVQIDYKTEICN